MFEILGGRKSFFQWDLNQKLTVFDDSITEVHFCNKTEDCALVCEVYNGEDGARVVNVPNILLQYNRCIRVYGVAADHTEHYARFDVISRSKPADYVYTETEVKTWDEFNDRLTYLEENGTSVEAINKAVEDYLISNPVEVDLTGYATESFVNNAVAGKLDATELPAAVDQALAQAKASGEFDGVGIRKIKLEEVAN